MKKIMAYIFLTVLCLGGVSTPVKGEEADSLITWEAPEEYANNEVFKVEVKKHSENNWEELFVYKVMTGWQNAEERTASSMVNFDFSGSVDVRVTYKKGKIENYDIRPSSLGTEVKQEENVLTFSMTQRENVTEKLVLRMNDSWDSECLHIMTNMPETEAPDKNAENVYVISEGDEIPLKLPEGKDTYYFEEGVHTLPGGMWAEFDLKESVSVDGFELHQGPFNGGCYSQRFLIEGKEAEEDSYQILYDGTGNRDMGIVGREFPEARVRYIRLRLLGANGPSGWRFSNVVNELKVFEAETGKNIAEGKAVAGAVPGYGRLADGDIESSFTGERNLSNAHSGETFFLAEDNTTVYMEPGSIVKGAFGAEGINGLTIKGRGILDCSVLDHQNWGVGEVRTGSVWLTSGKNNVLEGITILDSTMWTVVMNYSEAPCVSGINIFGSTVNADGIHLSGSRDGTIDGVFVRTCDDNIVMYHYGPTSGHEIKNCVLWTDEAHTFLIGLGTEPDADISNIHISNIDVLQQQGVYDLDKFNGVFKLWANGENLIRDIFICDVRIDPFKDPTRSCVFQLRTDERFAGEMNGSIENVYLTDIFYKGEGEMPSVLLGADEDHAIKNVVIRNYFRNSGLVEKVQDANIGIMQNLFDFSVKGDKSN